MIYCSSGFPWTASKDSYVWTCTLCPSYYILTCGVNDLTPRVDRYARASQLLFWLAQDHWKRWHNPARINFSCHVI